MRAAIRQILFGQTPFSPLRLFATGEQGVWYDPSDFSTMFQDSAGTTPVTAIEQPVGLILDKSGRGNHASQSTTTSRPILRQEASGRYYLAFDGADDWLQTANIDFSATNKMSVFAGVRKLSDAAVQTVVANVNSLGTDNGHFVLSSSWSSNNNQAGFRSRGTDGTAVTGTYTNNATGVLVGLGDISAPSSILRLNRAGIGSNTLTQGTGNYANRVVGIGARNDGSQKFNGHIYSLIIRGAMTSGTQLTQTEAWVNSKTGAY